MSHMITACLELQITISHGWIHAYIHATNTTNTEHACHTSMATLQGPLCTCYAADTFNTMATSANIGSLIRLALTGES